MSKLGEWYSCTVRPKQGQICHEIVQIDVKKPCYSDTINESINT